MIRRALILWERICSAILSKCFPGRVLKTDRTRGERTPTRWDYLPTRWGLGSQLPPMSELGGVKGTVDSWVTFLRFHGEQHLG